MTLVIFCAGCGIKGKPLPPLQATTQQLNETEPAVKEKKK